MQKLIDNNKLLLFLTLFFFTVLIATSGFYGLAETSEARYAEISREMILSGDFLHPQLLGIYHYHKPPLTYWLTALGYFLFGINEFGARFFLQTAIICQVILVYKIGKLIYIQKIVGFYSALTYIALPVVLISSRNLTTDGYFSTFIIAAIYSWLIYVKKNKTLGLYLFYFSISLALLTKGPVALIFIFLFIVIYRWQNDLRWRITKHHLLGLLICIAISSSWYIKVIADVPKLLDYFVFEQLVKRINADSFNRAKPFYFYIPLVVGVILPWLIFLGTVGKKELRKISLNKNDKILLLCSFLVLLIFSFFKTKLILYLLPMYWMLALFIGHLIYILSNKHLSKLSNIFLLFTVLIAFAPVIIGFSKANNYNSSVGIWSITILICLITFGINYAFRLKVKLLFTWNSIFFCVALLTISQQVLIQNPEYSNSVKPIVNKINDLNDGEVDGKILVYNYLLSSVPFYTNLNTITLQNNHDTTKRDVQFQETFDWKKNLIDLKVKSERERVKSICSRDQVYMLVKKNELIPKELDFLKKSFIHHIDYPKWILYYN